MTDRPLPQNIRIELEEWIGHADVFTLYTGFALHEGQKQPQLAGFTEQDISQSLRIVRSPDLLYRQLLQAELAPMLVKHGTKKFTQMPAAAKTIFPQKGKVKPAKRKTRKRIILQRKPISPYTSLPSRSWSKSPTFSFSNGVCSPLTNVPSPSPTPSVLRSRPKSLSRRCAKTTLCDSPQFKLHESTRSPDCSERSYADARSRASPVRRLS